MKIPNKPYPQTPDSFFNVTPDAGGMKKDNGKYISCRLEHDGQLGEADRVSAWEQVDNVTAAGFTMQPNKSGQWDNLDPHRTVYFFPGW